MKYKKAFEVDIPEWAVPGNMAIDTLTDRAVTVWAVERDRVRVRDEHSGFYVRGFDNLQPIEQWTPKVGEMVACWDVGDLEGFGFGVYARVREGDGAHIVSGCEWDYIYRIPETWKNLPEQNTPEWFEKNSERLV